MGVILSVCDRRTGVKVSLPRSGSDLFWRLIQQHFAQESELHWRYLAMLALRENAGWNLDCIGLVFGHPKGHVTRCLATIKKHLRERFQVEPEMHHHGEEEEFGIGIDIRETPPNHFGDAVQSTDPEYSKNR